MHKIAGNQHKRGPVIPRKCRLVEAPKRLLCAACVWCLCIETKMCVCYMQKIVRVFHCFSSPQQFLQDFSVGCRQRHAKQCGKGRCLIDHSGTVEPYIFPEGGADCHEGRLGSFFRQISVCGMPVPEIVSIKGAYRRTVPICTEGGIPLSLIHISGFAH